MRIAPMSSLLHDLRYAARQVARQPTFSTIVILTLALGIGASTTAFSILNGVALRPPDYPAIARLVSIHAGTVEDAGARAPLPLGALDGARTARTLDAVAIYRPRGINVESGERFSGADITADLFSVLGVRLALGRTFHPGEHDGDSAAAIVGHALSRRLFESETAAVGSTLVLDGRRHTIVGVAPEGFEFPSDAQVWLPLREDQATRGAMRAFGIGRLRPGEQASHADAELRAGHTTAAAESDPGTSRQIVRVAPLHDTLTSAKHRNAASALLVACGCVLFIACANLAGLLLANLAGRRRELAVRAAIGASRRRLVRLLLAEGLVLAAIGGISGTLLAQWAIDLFVATMGKPAGAGWMTFTLDARVLLFAVGATLLTTFAFSLAPALASSRTDLRRVMAEGSVHVAEGAGDRYRRLLVSAQMAVSLALVMGAAAVIGSAMGHGGMSTGFDRSGLLRARLGPAGTASGPVPASLLDKIVPELERLPGVQGVTVTSHAPLMDRDTVAARIQVDRASREMDQPLAAIAGAAADYFAEMRIPILRGRSFTESEARDPRSEAAIVNETFARRYWKDGDPVGRRIALMNGEHTRGLTIVGVVGDVAQRHLPMRAENRVYLPLVHTGERSIVLRAADPAAAASQARKAIATIDPALPVAIQTLDAALRWGFWDRVGQGLVLGAVGLVALLVSALGLFGVVSLQVAYRRREIGLRMALGSPPDAVLRLVIGAGLRLAAMGIAAGLVLGTAVTWGLAAIFHGVRPFDARLFVLSAGVLLATAFLACWWPARRAMQLDPTRVLRSRG